MVKSTKFLQALLGDWHTDHFLIGIIDDQSSANDAAEALREAGWQDEDFRLFHGEEAITTAEKHPEAAEEHQNLAKRFAITARDLSSNEGGLAEEYEEEMRKGRHLLAIYAPDGTHENRAQEVLQSHDAHHVECFGSWSIIDVRNEEEIVEEASNL
jgi:hypothetical protein